MPGQKEYKLVIGDLGKKDVSDINFDNSNCSLITFNHIVQLSKNGCDQFCKACNSFGIRFKLPELIKLNSSKNGDLMDELHNIKLAPSKKNCLSCP